MATQNTTKLKTEKKYLKRGSRNKPDKTRLRTVWITEQSQRTFEENYTTLKQIGEPGQFGKAFQCKKLFKSKEIKELHQGKIVAAKEISKARIYRLHPTDKIRQSLLTAMQSEIDIMRTLKHKYIVNMYETYETKHVLHIVMEQCTGGELFDRIKSKKRYPENDAKPVIRMICEALYYMHDKHRVVHCDLKPDNILFVNESENSDIKIIDFGMSKVLPRLRSLRELCGTPYYTAPEIINGQYSHPADMWSVGVIAYVMIFGFPPFYVDSNKYFGIRETKAIYKLILKGFNPTIKSGYGPWFPKSLQNKLSTMGQDFIGHLMEKNVGKRLTAKEALEHPWLQFSKKQNEAPVTEFKQETTEEKVNSLQFANFAASHKFKFVVTKLFRDQYKNMRPKHFENLKKLFHELDTDNNGTISYKEFEEGMLRSKDLKLDGDKIKQMFSELDVTNVGEINFNNLLNAAVHDYLVANDVRLYQAFRNLDDNGNGRITTAELKKKIIELDPYDNVNMLLQIIDDVDLDNDGTIDYEEFLRALHPDFNEKPNWIRIWTPNKHKDSAIDGDDADDDVLNSCMDPDDVPVELDADAEMNDEKMQSTQPPMAQMGSKSSIDPEAIYKQGFMAKEGKFIHSWKKRWFILQNNGKVTYYRNEEDERAMGSFSCKHMTKLEYKSWTKKIHGIKLLTPHRNWKFLCKNNDERKAWIKAFQNVSGLNKKT